MKNLTKQPHPWPLRHKRNHYGHEAPVKPLFLRIIAAIKKQMADRENREEAIVTLAVIAVIFSVFSLCMSLFPAAIDHEIDHGRNVVSESQGDIKP